MGLQLVLGGAGSGKSEYIYNDIINKSISNPDRNYIIVVPEQYTMATQKRIVNMHPRKGILNIDVVSFERLAFKVFEEIGGESRPVLDDTGKNLIVRRVLESVKDKLTYFGSGINKTGFVAELKSIISELLQYDIDINRLCDIADKSQENRLLSAKLNDISIVYKEFKSYLNEKYITSEEILDVLSTVIERSENIKKSELVFDGFTGFTPIQYKLLKLILMNSRAVQISVTIDALENPNVYEGMHNLFFMSKEMVLKLHKICDDAHIEILNPVVLNPNVNPRFISSEKNATDISFLEKNIFRYNGKIYGQKPENIEIFTAASPKEEVNYAVSLILDLTRFKGYRYKDIAVISGDMDTYGKLAGNICAQNDIPCFVDHKKSVKDNPFVEFIRSTIEVIVKNYSYDSVMRMLRTGFIDISRDEIDMLDNYLVATGIRGSSQWNGVWTKKGRGRNVFLLERLNELRVKITEPLQPLQKVLKDKNSLVRDYVRALYEYIAAMQCAAKISELGKLPETGTEYEQLYKKIIELLDKIYELLGSDKVAVSEFAKIVDSGFDEIKVGLIPPTSDCVLVGDIERTRLEDIKVLIFLGVNEGIVPKRAENRSVLSETDRDYLENMIVWLSPSLREKAFVQKFYLYLCLTKTSQKLYLAYSLKNSDGEPRLPSYLIRNIRALFPQIRVSSYEQMKHEFSYIKIPKAEIQWGDENTLRTIGQNLAMELYEGKLSGSVSAFEKFAGCSYAYFLQYGLSLEEREEYRFEVRDFGTVMHEVLERVLKYLSENKTSITLMSDEQRRGLVSECVGKITAEYNDTILKDSSRNEFLIKRMTDLADRTIWAVGKQLERGIFVPDAYEMRFLMDETTVELDNMSGTMAMKGVIDRIDICEDEENVYVRVVDYKTGSSDFDLLKAYYGLTMQLITYMRAAMKIEQKRHPDKNIVPSGLLYYNISDPVIETDIDDKDIIDEKIKENLAMKGVINDNEKIVKMMDDDIEGKSKVIPVGLNKDGSFDRYSKILSTEKFNILNDYIAKLSADIGKEILSGNIDVNPVKGFSEDACKYCSYKDVCGFSPDLGKSYRKLKKMSYEQIWENIREGVDCNGSDVD